MKKKRNKNMIIYPLAIVLIIILTLINNMFAVHKFNFEGIIKIFIEVIAIMSVSIFLTNLINYKKYLNKFLTISLFYGLIGGSLQFIAYGYNYYALFIGILFRGVVSFASLYISKFVVNLK